MALLFDATIGGSNSNALIAPAAWNQYFERRPFSAVWARVPAGDEQKKLCMAITRRYQTIDFLGQPTSRGQKLNWPRRYVPKRDTKNLDSDMTTGLPGYASYWPENEMPEPLVAAVCEGMIWMAGLTSDPAQPSGLYKFANIALPGGLNITPRDQSTAPAANRLPDEVLMYLSEFRASNVGVRFMRK